MIHVNERRLGLDRVSRDEAAFDKLVWRLLEQVTVFKRPWFMFACVADEIVFLHPMIEDLFPLDAGGKARAPSPTEPGFFQFIDDIVRAQLFDALLPGLVAPDLPVGLDIPGSAIKRLENSCSVPGRLPLSFPLLLH